MKMTTASTKALATLHFELAQAETDPTASKRLESVAETAEALIATSMALKTLLDEIDELVGSDIIDPDMLPSLESARNEVLS